MTALTLPKLAGSRDLVIRLLEDIPDDLGGDQFVVDAESLASAAPSFADQLCKEILETRHASSMTVRDASPRFAQFLHRSATARGLHDRLNVELRSDVEI